MSDLKKAVESSLNEARLTLETFIREENTLERIGNMADALVACFRRGNKVLICGNGGSACDALHFAEECTGRFRKERSALPVIPLLETGFLTCVSNDYGFEHVFARGVEAYGKPGDLLIAISTSGNSTNVVRAVEAARKGNLEVHLFIGKEGGVLRTRGNEEIWVRSNVTERIQEVHMTVLHILVESIERRMFPEKLRRLKARGMKRGPLFSGLLLAASLLSQAAVKPGIPETEAWIQKGQRALKDRQDALAKGYFDQAIALSGNSPDPIVRIGLLWIKNDRVETSLPYLLPNLRFLNPFQLSRLGKFLESRHHLSAAILVYRYQAAQSSGFSEEAAHAAELAFASAQFDLCVAVLAPHADALDPISAYRLLMANFQTGAKLSPDVIRKTASRSPDREVQILAASMLSLQGNFREARSLLSESSPVPVKGFLRARELDAEDKTDDAVDFFKQGMDSQWPEFRVIVISEFFKHYSLTGNRYKVDQLWDEIKEQEENDTLPAMKELLANQLALRGYEKQSRYLYRNLYRSNPGRPQALKVLWDELIPDDSSGLNLQISLLLQKDSLDCDANLFAMRYAKAHSRNGDVVHHGRNVVLYCPEAVEPYFDLANALLAVSRPEEARRYFGKFVQRGGDRNRVPTYMR